MASRWRKLDKRKRIISAFGGLLALIAAVLFGLTYPHSFPLLVAVLAILSLLLILQGALGRAL